ncbi:amino acid ABC transporter substrate-binding protein [Bacteriovorax sp. DB6_IX]|uniref:amino acid ABC transporter substrate-binding protein n=1 Tax=Bacteriovorax sp. DB6_IX TaxID=1353530 RepID=UPI00038A044E|nr:amino acid ABC transporter substrate-binding protein [Bacteriovorax sp. DB6_IX]EQC51043.1 general L-amino acid-binding periplasmic protein AapJ [Bacteriovorax sp. DB6_IX]
MKKLLILALLSSSVFAGKTLDAIKKRGNLKCGVSTGLPGFSFPDSKGNWKGIDVDFCKALSIAVFGNASRVKYVSLNAQQRFTALQSGEIDVLSRNTTNTLTRDTSTGLNFTTPLYYDGQAFMVRKKSGITSAKQLNGASVCTQQGTTTELNVSDYFRANRMKLKPVVFESNDEVVQSFVKGRCDALTTDASGLASERSKFKNPEDFVILPEIISKEPLAPAVRQGDDEWFDIVKWTMFALIQAEELGLNSKNVDSFKKSKDPRIKRFLGRTPGVGKSIGLDEKWAYNVVKLLGNYGEIYEANIGINSPLKLKRGLNSLWTDGGLMYSPPFR